MRTKADGAHGLESERVAGAGQPLQGLVRERGQGAVSGTGQKGNRRKASHIFGADPVLGAEGRGSRRPSQFRRPSNQENGGPRKHAKKKKKNEWRESRGGRWIVSERKNSRGRKKKGEVKRTTHTEEKQGPERP